MKKHWSLRSRASRAKIWLFLGLFCSSLLTLTLGSALPAHADQQGTWVDKVTITIGDTRYVDSDIFDALDYYEGNYHSGTTCGDNIHIDNFAGGGSTGELQKKKVITQTGECVNDGGTEKVTLTNTDARNVNAYQIDADHVYMPEYPQVDNLNALQFDQNANGYNVSKDGMFVRLDSQTSSCQDGNNSGSDPIDKGKCALFARIQNGIGDVVDGKANWSVWVTTEASPPEIRYVICTNVITICSVKSKGVVFANNRATGPPPAAGAYNVPNSNGGAAGTTGGNNATATPTCESNNPTVIIGWLMCAFIGALDGAVNAATTVVNNLLSISGEDLTGGKSADQLHTVWSLFRALASFALLAVALIMIFGQALGGE